MVSTPLRVVIGRLDDLHGHLDRGTASLQGPSMTIRVWLHPDSISIIQLNVLARDVPEDRRSTLLGID